LFTLDAGEVFRILGSFNGCCACIEDEFDAELSALFVQEIAKLSGITGSSA